MVRPRRACRGPKDEVVAASGSPSLLQLPDPLLLVVLQFCADDPSSMCSAAIAHSRLHQAAVLALTSITADVEDDQERLDSLLLYLQKHGQHVDSITVTGDIDIDELDEDKVDISVTLHKFPANLQLHSLECNNMDIVQSLQNPDGFRMVLDPGASLKHLRLEECFLNGGVYMSEGIAGALKQLTTLEHLCIKGCRSDTYDNDICVVACTDEMFEALTQLTYLELSDVLLHHCDEAERPAEPNLQALTRLVDLRLSSYQDDVASVDMLSGLCRLTRLDLANFEGLDAGVLAGKTLLQHLDLWCYMTNERADAAELLSQLQPLQQLTHLSLAHCWSHLEEGSIPPAAAFSALTASSKLHYLSIKGCTVPTGAWQHMFPAGRQLPQLRRLDLSFVKTASGGKATAPEGSGIVQCCPGLETLDISGLRCTAKQLAPLKKLKGLDVHK